MKKIYVFILFGFLISGSLYSQQPKNEIYGAYGFASVQEIANMIGDALILAFSAEDYTTGSTLGPIILGYRRNLSEPLSIGLKGSYTHFDKEYTVSSTKFRIKNTFTTVMANGNVCYNPRNIVQLYSGLNAGFSVVTQSDDSSKSASKTTFAFQVNALGIRIGNKIGGFAEFGFGFDGVINAGLSVKF